MARGELDLPLRKSSQLRRFLSPIYATVSAILLNLATGSALDWVVAHLPLSSLVLVVWTLLPAIVHEFIERRLTRRYFLLPRAGRPGPPELTALLRVAHAILERQCTKAEADPAKAKTRVTLFIPDEEAGRMRQLARWTWDGRSEVSNTSVVIGTCAAGHAWNTREAFRLTVAQELGFVKALQRCGVAEKDAIQHNSKDRQLFVSVPVFENASDQAPFDHAKVPDDKAVAVLVADAAVDCLPVDWYAELHRVVFPALVCALRDAPQSKHLFFGRQSQGSPAALPPALRA